jgi:hypothetical protein
MGKLAHVITGPAGERNSRGSRRNTVVTSGSGAPPGARVP